MIEDRTYLPMVRASEVKARATVVELLTSVHYARHYGGQSRVNKLNPPMHAD